MANTQRVQQLEKESLPTFESMVPFWEDDEDLSPDKEGLQGFDYQGNGNGVSSETLKVKLTKRFWVKHPTTTQEYQEFVWLLIYTRCIEEWWLYARTVKTTSIRTTHGKLGKSQNFMDNR